MMTITYDRRQFIFYFCVDNDLTMMSNKCQNFVGSATARTQLLRFAPGSSLADKNALEMIGPVGGHALVKSGDPDVGRWAGLSSRDL